MSAPTPKNLTFEDLKRLLNERPNNGAPPLSPEAWQSSYISTLIKSLYEPIVPIAAKPIEDVSATQELSDVERLKRRIEELKTQVEQLEEQCTNLENGYNELKERVAVLSDDTAKLGTADDSAEDADDEAADTPEESEEEEEEEVEPAAHKRDESLPCEITVAASLLLLVYVFRLFLYVCDLTSCSRNRIVLKDL